jgi:hypothetical protein
MTSGQGLTSAVQPEETADQEGLLKGREILLEFVPHGSSVKVSAIDAATGTEVSIVGHASAGQRTLENVAVRKLAYVMRVKGLLR